MISIILCTYNRADALIRCLGSLESVTVPAGLDWEVVVVDNNSKDRTREIVTECQQRNTIRAVYVFEGQQGKSYALNRGLECANGDIVAFIDDDCVVDKNWLNCLNEEFRLDCDLSGIGGRVELYNIQDRAVSIRTSKQRAFLELPSLFNLIPGCNMAFRRAVIETVGEFDTGFGPGTKMVVEDADFIYRVFKRGYKIAYSPDILLYHNHGRRTDEQVKALNRSYVMGRGGFYCKHILLRDRDILKMAYWETRSIFKGIFKQLITGQSPAEDFGCLLNLTNGALRELLNKFGSGRLTLRHFSGDSRQNQLPQ